MKRFLSITLAALVLAMCGTMAIDAKKKTSGKKSRTVYYLVINSCTSLSQAIEERNDHAADEVLTCPIYVTKDDDGITRYRTVWGQYNSRKEAAKEKALLVDFYGWDDIWIWKSNGSAKLAAPGGSLR